MVELLKCNIYLHLTPEMTISRKILCSLQGLWIFGFKFIWLYLLGEWAHLIYGHTQTKKHAHLLLQVRDAINVWSGEFCKFCKSILSFLHKNIRWIGVLIATFFKPMNNFYFPFQSHPELFSEGQHS